MTDKEASKSLLLDAGPVIQTVKYNGEDRVQFRARGVQLVSPPTTADKVDTTTRITIPSYQGGGGSQFGEGVRLMVNDKNAKNMIAWYDQFTDPERPKLRAWIGYHYGTYLGTVHDHISMETPDSRGALNTRFGISTELADVTDIDFNMSDVQHTASQGGKFRLAVTPAMQSIHPRELLFSTGTDHADSRRRWGIQADNTPEKGNGTGSHFRIIRYDDDGKVTGAPLSIHRNNGRIGLNTEPNASSQVTIKGTTQALRLIGTESSAEVGLLRAQTSRATGTAFETRVGASDTHSRFTISGSGSMEWGTGSHERDTFLRRAVVASSPVLRTINEVHIDAAGKGLLMHSPNGTQYRISVSDAGSVTAIAMKE